MIIPIVVHHLGPPWAHLDPFGPFQTKMNFLPQMEKVGFGGGAPEQKKEIFRIKIKDQYRWPF